VLNYNIDTNIGKAEEGCAAESHVEWRANKRIPNCVIPTIDKIIVNKRPGIIHVQEGRHFKTKNGEVVNSVDPLVSAFEGHGYRVEVVGYNNTGDRAFKYITAYDPTLLKCKQAYVRHLTLTPGQPTAAEVDIKKNTGGGSFERAVSIIEFEHAEWKEPIYSINVHEDLPGDHRVIASDALVYSVLEILAHAPDAKIVMSGDFNAFPEQGRRTDEQLAILKNATFHDAPLLKEASERLLYPNPTKAPNAPEATSTFVGFPYDFFGAPIKGTKINDAELTDLIERLPPAERAHAEDVFSKMPQEQFELTTFLSALTDIGCRKLVIGLIYEQCRTVGGKLDRSYYRGFDSSKCTLMPAPQFPDAPIHINDDKTVKDYVLRHHGDGPAYASDHQPMMTSLVARGSKDVKKQ
jgi:hypothetical protein